MKYRPLSSGAVKALMEGLETCRRDAQIELRAAGISEDPVAISYWTAGVTTLDAIVEKLNSVVQIPEEKSDFSRPVDG